MKHLLLLSSTSLFSRYIGFGQWLVDMIRDGTGRPDPSNGPAEELNLDFLSASVLPFRASCVAAGPFSNFFPKCVAFQPLIAQAGLFKCSLPGGFHNIDRSVSFGLPHHSATNGPLEGGSAPSRHRVGSMSIEYYLL